MGEEMPDKESVSSQGRCVELSSESRTEGRELDVEEHLRNLPEAITERESSELQRTRPKHKWKWRKNPREVSGFPGDIMAWHGGGQSAKNECL